VVESEHERLTRRKYTTLKSSMIKRNGRTGKLDIILPTPGMAVRGPIKNMESVRIGTPEMTAAKARHLTFFRDHFESSTPTKVLTERFKNPILKTT